MLSARRDGCVIVIERPNRGGWASRPIEEVDRLSVENARIFAAQLAQASRLAPKEK